MMQMPRSRESDFATGSIRRLTGKQYTALEQAFETMSPEALRELVQLVRDIESTVQSAKRQGEREPWRHL